MIKLFPKPSNSFICPACKSSNTTVEKTVFQGIHLLADARCNNCGFTFYHDYPTGHAVVYAAAIDKKNGKLLYPHDRSWLTEPLLQSLAAPSGKPINIQKQVNNPAVNNAAILVNCLDAWYGHVLLKLFNLQFYHQLYPHLKKIVLIPKGFEWMVPFYADEVWIADIRLSETKNYFTQLEQFINSGLSNYSEVFYSSGFSHPALHEIDIPSFFKTAPFDSKRFAETPPTITFIYREDRLWLTPKSHSLFNFLKNRKLPFSKLFVKRQIKKINQLAEEIIKVIPAAKLYVCGIGDYGKFSNLVKDARATQITATTELEWCKLYAQSHVVVGIHGSNMLIPSALAAGFVEILPDDRLTNITQDLFCKYNNSNMLFYGRFVSEYDPVSRVANVISSLLSAHPFFTAHQQIDYTLKPE